jgi:hypothetical protein
LAGDWCDQHCVASHAVRLLGLPPCLRKKRPPTAGFPASAPVSALPFCGFDCSWCRKSPVQFANIPVLGRLWPETLVRSRLPPDHTRSSNPPRSAISSRYWRRIARDILKNPAVSRRIALQRILEIRLKKLPKGAENGFFSKSFVPVQAVSSPIP